MVLSTHEVNLMLEDKKIKKDTYKLIKYSDEVKEKAVNLGNILNRSSIIKILSELREEEKIPDGTSNYNFIKYMVDILDMFDEVVIFDERKGSTVTRYVAKYIAVSPYEIALSLLSKSFLSHYSALYVHDITINNPKDIYINKEQSKKPNKKEHKQITQGRIDYAFSKKMRATTMVYNFQYKGEFFRVHVLNSKNTQNTGIIFKQPINFSKKIKVTNLERTLIDVVVRPQYSGGVKEILDSYIRAKKQLNINKLIKYLDKFDYSYPYFKSILFFLKYANYNPKILDDFRKKYDKDLNNNVNFYLDYQIVRKNLDKNIGIYYPAFLTESGHDIKRN